MISPDHLPIIYFKFPFFLIIFIIKLFKLSIYHKSKCKKNIYEIDIIGQQKIFKIHNVHIAKFAQTSGSVFIRPD